MIKFVLFSILTGFILVIAYDHIKLKRTKITKEQYEQIKKEVEEMFKD